MIRAALAQQPAAVEQLLGRLACVPRIVRALNRRLGFPFNEHDLQDSVQDVVLVIWRRLSEYDGTARLERWAYRISLFTLMNRLRKQRGKAMLLGGINELEQAVKVGPSSAPLWEIEAMYEALRSLGADEERVISLKHFEGLTFEEIGAVLQISPNTAKTRYYRGRERLQELLVAGGRARSSQP